MTRFTLSLYFIGYLLLACLSTSAQKSNEQKVVDNFVSLEIFKSASIGIEIRNLETGKLLAENDSEKSLTPASTQKLVTTATALEILGADFQFRTDVYITGRIDKDGILMGNLVIRGFGDPTLASKYFPKNNRFISSIHSELKKLGIHQINGKLIVDHSFFKSSIPRTWIWEDIGNYYGAIPHPLTYKDNTYTLHFESKKAGQLSQIKTIENNQVDLEFTNEVMASSINRDRAYIFGGTSGFQRKIEGTIPQNQSDYKIKGALSKPQQVLVQDLKTILNADGIKINEQTHKVKTQRLLIQFNSPQLKDIVAITNQKSINLFADHLLFQIGYEKNKKADWQSGITAIKTFWQTKGIDSKNLFLYDGSGLSHFNALSAHTLNQILVYMNKSNNSDAFFNSLPIAGKNGTLKNFGKQSPLAGNLKAKTGSMTSVRSYSGILSKPNGQQIAISFIINNYTCKSREVSKQFKNLLLELSNK